MFNGFRFVEVAFYLEARTPVVNFDVEVVSDLLDVAIELAAEVGKALGIFWFYAEGDAMFGALVTVRARLLSILDC